MFIISWPRRVMGLFPALKLQTIILFFCSFIYRLALLHVLASEYSFPIATPNCQDRCGNVSIPFPFGTTPECYQSSSFLITCKHTHFNPPQPFLVNSTIEVTDISLDGQLTILNFVGRNCFYKNGTRVRNLDRDSPWLRLDKTRTVNTTANKFTIVGCDTYGEVSGRRLNGNPFKTACGATCESKGDLIPGSCTGLGCCQISIPKDVWRVDFSFESDNNHRQVWNFSNCSYAFLAAETSFNFSQDSLTNLWNVENLPLVLDWAIGNETCESAKNGSGYACKSVNSTCYNPTSGNGYRCTCLDGYRGNPYLLDGCRDIDECQDPQLHDCEKACENTRGSFRCYCPRGYHGEGKRTTGRGCIRDQSSVVFKLVAGISIGAVVLLLSTYWLHSELKRRKLIKMRHLFFLQNGGTLLQEKLACSRSSSDHHHHHVARIFMETDLQKATNNFHSNMIIGQGGYGTVYKGTLLDDRDVAIKKSKVMNPDQIEQFINEVIILSQINHRNVVKLIGCCLETQVPLLVYEFIDNGTLFQHIHNREKARRMSWDLRLKIATETAGVLSYLHSAASPPIIHRDVKAANILLDKTYTAKVSDFGSSKLVPSDELEMNTLVKGTLGYLDPEYMQTNQLTEKSDVYSFGVVLVELMSGMKALNYNRPQGIILANLFLTVMAQGQGHLFQFLDENIRDVIRSDERIKTEIMKVAELAKRCLRMRGEERPFMKAVSMELEELLGRKLQHSCVQTTTQLQMEGQLLDEKGLIGGGLSINNTSGEGDSSNSIKSSGLIYYSAEDHCSLLQDGDRR